MSLAQSKQQLRLGFLKKMKSLSADVKKSAEPRLNQNLIQFLKSQNDTWTAYQPLPGEVDILEAVRQSSHIRWCFPRVSGDGLEFYTSPNFSLGSFSILEPHPEVEHKVELKDIRGFLIPAVAFDRRGHRLGRGKAYFDKTLQNHKGTKVGVSFAEFVSDKELPIEEHDVKMNYLVTDNEILHC